jgi:hypothetical protein
VRERERETEKMYVWARHIKPMAIWFKETLKLDLEHRK